MQRRNIVSVILLSIVTCGIYALYWQVVVTNEIEYALAEISDGSCRSGGLALLFSILTCGIYTIYWYYKEAKRLEILAADLGVRVSNEAWLYVILCIFGLEIVNIALMQDDLNKLADAQQNR